MPPGYAAMHRLWEAVTGQMPILRGLSAAEKTHLRELCALFLHEKRFIAVQELQLTDAMRLEIAAQACLPILNLGLDLLSEWTTIIVYPDTFLVDREITDDIGIVHRERQALNGESWERGPLILSWRAVEADRSCRERGYNVVIHEIAHKLDMLDGAANGRPPLHYRMDGRQWTAALSSAYAELTKRLEQRRQTCLDAYAAESPAEFFAVVSECFFTAPDILHAHFPAVYNQLQLYYRQDPLRRAEGFAD